MEAPRRLRFGLQDTAWGPDPTAAKAYIADTARRAEAAGFDAYTTADHPLPSMRPPLATLLVAAEATTTLRIGTLVLNNDFWNPVLLAREAATLHLLSGGRLELGLGAGHAKPDYDLVGVPYQSDGTRVARLAESVPLIRRLLAGETVSFVGKHYRTADASLGVPGANVPVRILVGGNGDTVLRTAARYADIVGITGLIRAIDGGHVHQPNWSASYLDDRIGFVRDAAGSRSADLELNALVQRVEITEDREAAAAAFCAEVATVGVALRVQEALATPFLLFGTVAEIAAQIRAAADRFGLTYFTTRVDSLDVMAQVIAELRPAGRESS